MVNFMFKFTVLPCALSGKQGSYTKGALASKSWGFEILRVKVHYYATESS